MVTTSLLAWCRAPAITPGAPPANHPPARVPTADSLAGASRQQLRLFYLQPTTQHAACPPRVC